MGIFDDRMVFEFDEDDSEFTIELENELIAEFLLDDIRRMSDSEKKAFLEGGGLTPFIEAGIIVEDDNGGYLTEGLVGKNTVVRLSRADDLERRITIAAINSAKEKNDPLFEKLRLNRVRERKLLSDISKKYQSTATRKAKKASRAYIKLHGYSNAFVKQ